MKTFRLVGIAIMAVTLAVALSGCRYYWIKPGSTAEAFNADSQTCLQEARSATPATERYGVVNQDIYRSCLQSRGYQRDKRMPPQHGQPLEPGVHRGYEFDD